MAVPSYPSPEEASRAEGFLQTRDGLRLYWVRHTPAEARGRVALLPGGGDHSGRYPALTSALVRAGFEVASLDFRGHGHSDGRRWHIRSFDDYLCDLDAFMAWLRDEPGGPRGGDGGGGRTFVVAHSQGALVAIAWALAAPRAVAGFVLSSPYLRLKFAPPRLKVLAARMVGTVVPWLPVSTGLRVEDLTSDPEMQRWTDGDPLYGRSTTPRWFVESRRAQAQVLLRARSFTYPMLVLAGSGDPIADPAAERAFYEESRSVDKAFRAYEGFRHELFNERERERPIADCVAWLSSHVS
jgi:alpha-beta hydrolase superfamily lysophospholipase